MSDNYQYVKIEAVGRCAVLTMDRAPVNAVNQEMYGEILDVFSRFDEVIPDVDSVVLTGAGRHFSAGNDLGEFLSLTSQNSPGRMKLVREAFASIYDCPVPVIAAVRGSALGTGLAIAACCDLVICADTAKFGTPEIGVGVMGAAKHLSRLVPQQVARLMFLTADPVPAAELLRYGGVVAVVPDGELGDRALELAARITRHSSVAIRAAKEALNTIEYMDLKSGYEFEQRLTGRLAGSADSMESRKALVEKRPPQYWKDAASGLDEKETGR